MNTERQLDAWTPRAFREALALPEIADDLTAERLLDELVGDGLLVRISQDSRTLYIPGDLVPVLEGLGIAPVEGERLAERRAEVRQLAARERVRRLKRDGRDEKGDRA